MYLTYDEYLEMGGNTNVDETAFENLEFEARSQIDYWTFDRLTKEEDLPEAVKRCMYWIITKLIARQELLKASLPNTSSNNTTISTGGIMSQSNDGVSISYNTVSATSLVNNLGAEIKQAIDSYLGNVKTSLGRRVTYRGIYPDE